MVKKTFGAMPCTLAQALNVIGEWWTMLIVRDFYLGHGTRRFEQLRDSLGISRNILTERLKTLTESGVIERVPLHEGGRRHAYQLTEKGRDLLPVMISILQWSEKWQACRDEDRLIVVREKSSGEEIAPLAVSNAKGEIVGFEDLYLTVNGPEGEELLTEWPPQWWLDMESVDRAS